MPVSMARNVSVPKPPRDRHEPDKCLTSHCSRSWRKDSSMKPITPENATLGFVGIGYMGRPIAQRLLQSGFTLFAYDRTPSRADALVRSGATVVRTIAEVAARCNVLLTCLATEEAVVSTLTAENGVFANLPPQSLVIEMSTISPEASLQLAKLGAQHQIQVLDVTISGSTPAAEKGALTLFGGGDPDSFHAAEPLFRAIAHKYFLLGSNGSGAKMKLVVNALLGIGMQAIAETVALGEKAGLERGRLLDVLSETAVIAPALRDKLQRAKLDDYSPQFPLRLMNKDFGLILSLASAVGAQLPATEAAFEVNARETNGGAERDFSAVILQMEKRDRLVTPPQDLSADAISRN
jgi:3-hydroxyisobutyrate dehydrogenase